MEHLHSTARALKAHFPFILFSMVSLLFFGRYLEALVRLSLRDDRYSHLLLIPIMSASLVYLERRTIFVSPQYCLSKGLPLLIVGIGIFGLAQTLVSTLTTNYRSSVIVLAIVLIWMAGFVLCYGAQSFRAALFPLLFLLLMIPIPTVGLDYIILVLRKGSAVMTYAVFKLLGVPVLWQHFKFLLPGVEIEIAEECSGVRSTFALFITSILTGYVFLQSNWRKASFSLFTVPVVIFKNAVRIVTITCLGVYVNPAFLHGKLHRYGGLPFSLVSLAILVPFLLVLQKGERCHSESPGTTEGPGQSAIESNSRTLNLALK